MSFDWNPFKMATGGFAKFETVGDEAVGKIVALRTHKFPNQDNAVPIIDLEPLDGGETVSVVVDKVDLLAQIPALNPQVGDLLAVKFTGKEKIAGSTNTKKMFAVRHKPGERQPEPDPFSDPEPDPMEEPF